MMERRQSSGQSVQAFCEAEHINQANYNWHKRLNEIRETSKIIQAGIEKAEYHPVLVAEWTGKLLVTPAVQGTIHYKHREKYEFQY